MTDEINLDQVLPEDRKQLRELAQPFKKVAKDNRGNDYVGHAMVTQKILATLGATSFEVSEIVRGWIPEHQKKPAQDNAIVGCLATMMAVIDGESVVITEVGECDNPQVHPHDGVRLKMAASDAYKRCAMRLSVGLHLWSKDGYVLSDRLETAVEQNAPSAPPEAVDVITNTDEELAIQTIQDNIPGAEVVETIGDQMDGTPMGSLMALPPSQVAKAKRTIEDANLWPLPASWDDVASQDRVTILGIIAQYT